MCFRSRRKSAWVVGIVPDHLQGRGDEPGGRVLARGEEQSRRAHDIRHGRRRPVGERGHRQLSEDVVAWRAAAVLDIGSERLEQVRERVA